MADEYWLRGPVEGVPGLLQPVVHALLQSRDEVQKAVSAFPQELIWEQPAGVASVGFHLQHIAGVLDRLFTYARGEQLSAQQLDYLAAEGKKDSSIELVDLLKNINLQVDKAVSQIKTIDIRSLMDFRGVGRKQIPSTVSGLLFHAAEHTMRHTGQLLVTVKVLQRT